MAQTPPPTGLPVEACVAAVRAALADPGVGVLEAPPGAGKTTVVPLRLLDAPWLGDQRIVVLEPRRLAARAAARRMADLLDEPVGGTVGYRTRDERRVSGATRIEVITEGILTRRLQDDAELPGVGLVVFDEVHERNLHTDLALALTLDARAVLRPDLRVLAMSATVDIRSLAGLLGPGDALAPVITSAGRTHPVELRWRPPDPRVRPDRAVADVVAEALASDPGDVLVFLAGAADIGRVRSQLTSRVGPDVDVRRLFGALSPAEQDAALAPSPAGRRRVVLATDIAETSLTVEGVRIVVDSGLVRVPRNDPRTGLTRLHTTDAARSSTDQRSGRAGRTAPGVAYRLWSAAGHATRPPYATPEIDAVELSGLALELAVWGTPPEQLAFLDAPPPAALSEARRLLVELGALTPDGGVTPTGRTMATLPVHPRLARLVLGAADGDLAAVGCLLAALLDERDVWAGHPDDRPADVVERVRLLAGHDVDDARVDRDAVRLVRRRAQELRRRLGGSGTGGRSGRGAGRRGGNGTGGRSGGDDAGRRSDEIGDVDLGACGPLLALAYPDRIAQARGGGRFRLRTGSGAWLPTGDPLTAEGYLVVAELDVGRRLPGEHPGRGRRVGAGARPGGGGRGAGGGPPSGGEDGRIRMAVALDEAELEASVGADIESVDTVRWDEGRDDLRRRRERRLGALVLSAHEDRAEPGPATAAALADRVRDGGLALLGWTDAARALQRRVAFVRRADPHRWPDLSDAGLVASVDEWLTPRLAGATGRRDLAAVAMGEVLARSLGHLRPELDRLAPVGFAAGSGRSVPIDYAGDQPASSVRPQEMFGVTTHPTIGPDRTPVVLALLSPAGRPVQVTADLPGFWAGSWREVRREMAGRYPKHDWPEDPTVASPTLRGARRS